MGIVLAVSGAGLYFLRSFKPALARDYDVFFAAIGLLCGGILFFQGWRLDPILQFGQFLLAGTTVFFAYESVRLRGVATDQARRSSYFDDEPAPARMPGGGRNDGWDQDSYDQFEESQPFRRRFSSFEDRDLQSAEDNLYRSRRSSRAAIPEEAASRSVRERSSESSGSRKDDSERVRRMSRFSANDDERARSDDSFGQRRNARTDQRRGSRPSLNEQTSSRRRNFDDQSRRSANRGEDSSFKRSRTSQGTSTSQQAEDAAYTPTRQTSSRFKRNEREPARGSSDFSSQQRPSTGDQSPKPRRRDNSSMFDD